MPGAAIFVLLTVTAADVGALPSSGRPLTMVDSPEIVGGMVTFRLRAPRAKEVIVDVTGASLRALERDVEGVWSGRLGPLPPGIYSYQFIADGLHLADRANPWNKPGRWAQESVFEVAGGHEIHDTRPVPRGTLAIREYESSGRRRRIHVYTPPDYPRGEPFPTIYLLHGMSDTDATWSEFGRAHVILDNLIAERRLGPVVVVMPDGHSLALAGRDRRGYLSANVGAFERELGEEIVPLVERTFRVLRGPAARGAIGFDTGAQQALLCAQQFRAIAAIGPPLLPERAPDRPTEWVFLALPLDDAGLPSAERLVSRLAGQAITASLVRVPASMNPWPRWRRDLADTLPRVLARLARR